MTRTPTKQKQSSTPGGLVSGAVLARWLGVTDHTVREMAKAGIVVRVARGLYPLEENVTVTATTSGRRRRNAAALTA
jgi:Transcriptional regulator, AbiEi antitoxin